MVKKQSKRPVRSKSAPRRSPARSVVETENSSSGQTLGSGAGVLTAGIAPAASTNRGTSSAASGSVSVRRPVNNARRAVGITINYGFLRHDLLLLAVLAPLMVLLVIAAYFVFH